MREIEFTEVANFQNYFQIYVKPHHIYQIKLELQLFWIETHASGSKAFNGNDHTCNCRPLVATGCRHVREILSTTNILIILVVKAIEDTSPHVSWIVMFIGLHLSLVLYTCRKPSIPPNLFKPDQKLAKFFEHGWFFNIGTY